MKQKKIPVKSRFEEKMLATHTRTYLHVCDVAPNLAGHLEVSKRNARIATLIRASQKVPEGSFRTARAVSGTRVAHARSRLFIYKARVIGQAILSYIVCT